MSVLGRVSIAAMALALASVAPTAVWAQDEHSGHHPTDAPASTNQPSTPQPDAKDGATGMGGQKGMMAGQNMPTQGMMGGMPMCGMMGGGMMGGMNISAHIDERLGAIRSELKITAVQTQSWDAYASAMRAAAANMDKMRGSMMAGRQGNAPMSLIERLDHHDRMIAAADDHMRTLRPALERLYGQLSAEQKRKADTLLVPHGMMQQMPMGGTMRQ